MKRPEIIDADFTVIVQAQKPQPWWRCLRLKPYWWAYAVAAAFMAAGAAHR